LIFLDVNVVIYAQGKPHPFKGRCQKIMNRLVDHAVDFAINTEILQEVIYFYHRRKRLDWGLQTYRVLTEYIRDILPVSRITTDIALELLTEHEQILSYRDAIHVATMREAGIKEILSFDRHLDSVDGIKRVEP